jgi:hypothetical protein
LQPRIAGIEKKGRAAREHESDEEEGTAHGLILT